MFHGVFEGGVRFFPSEGFKSSSTAVCFKQGTFAVHNYIADTI